MITIRKFYNKDTEEVADLVGSVFSEFNKKEGHKEAINKYIGFYKSGDVKELEKLFMKSKIFFVALDGKKIIGMIRGNKDRIFNLFVLGRYHKNGIGRKLMNSFEEESKKNKSKIVKVRSSLFAQDFYKKLGYKKSTGTRFFKGIQVVPMKKKLI